MAKGQAGGAWASLLPSQSHGQARALWGGSIERSRGQKVKPGGGGICLGKISECTRIKGLGET